METYTLTFGDCAENHVGMQKIGEICSEGFTVEDLIEINIKVKEAGLKFDFYDLTTLLENEENVDMKDVDGASVLVIRNGVDFFVNADELFKEQKALNHDKKAFMYGRVVNKRARYNLCFAEEEQEPDYENKKGRIIAYSNVPTTAKLRENLPKIFGPKAKDLMLEGNYYYDSSKCGIGYHGDTERRKVIGVRLGKKMPLVYQWYAFGKKIGQKQVIELNNGDMYIMSEKAGGFDWKSKNKYTLRHAAGCKKFTEV